ncbi:MAG: hypothetical protein ACI8PZ_001730 [Myxococcota bacterium]|jgi:hypothetical protein
MRILLTIALLFPLSAFGEEPCSQPVAGHEWREALDWIDRYFGEEDLHRAGLLIEWTRFHLPCLTEVVHPSDLARFAQQVSFQATLDEDPEAARSWAQLAMVAAPKTPLPDWMPASHTGRVAISAVAPPQIASIDDKGVIHPRGGGVFLDGNFLRQPVAAVEVNHLVQIADRRGRITGARWQHGPSFDDAIVGPDLATVSPPNWWIPPTVHTRDDYVTVGAASDRRRRRFTAAAALGGATAGLYGLSWASRAAYQGSYSDGLYATTNGAVIASGAAGAAAVGVLTAALLTPKER